MFSSQMNRWWKKTTTTTPPLQQKYVRLDDSNNNNNNTEMKGNTQDMFWHKLWKSERAVNNWNTSLAWSRLTYSFVTRSVNRQALFLQHCHNQHQPSLSEAFHVFCRKIVWFLSTGESAAFYQFIYKCNSNSYNSLFFQF